MLKIMELDTYRIAALAANAGTTDNTAATTSNAYELFLAGQEVLGNARVPVPGRVAYMSFAFYNMLKLDPSFVQAGNSAEISLARGILGFVDGVPLIPVPSSLLPTDTQFILVHPIAATAPVKLQEFHIHVDPPGISGNLVEGRVYYDAFVLDNKKDAIYASIL